MTDSPLTQTVLDSLGLAVSAAVTWASCRYRASYFPRAEPLGRRVSLGLAVVTVVMAYAVVSDILRMVA